jgi:hypothetical protein
MIDVLSDEQIEEVAEDYIKRGIKEQMRMSRRDYKSLDYLNGLCHWLNVAGFPYKYDKTDSRVIMRMRFDMGKKWCIFIGRIHELMFRDFGVEDLTVEITDNSVTLTIQT